MAIDYSTMRTSGDVTTHTLNMFRAWGYRPIILDSRTKLDLKNCGKVPLLKERSEKLKSDAELDDAAATGYNIGLRLPDTALVVDIDPRHGGDESFERLKEELHLDDIEEHTLVVHTGGGGWHLIFRKRADTVVRKTLRDYPGIDFLTGNAKSYIVCAGSFHYLSGHHYELDEWSCWSTDKPPAAPKALLKKIIKKRVKPCVPTAGSLGLSNDELAELLSDFDAKDFRDQDEWLRMAMACHHMTGGAGYDAFSAWSASDPQYEGDGTVWGRWESLGKDGGVEQVTHGHILQLYTDGYSGLLAVPDWFSERCDKLKALRVVDEFSDEGDVLDTVEHEAMRYPLTELGNAERLVEYCGQDCLYNGSIGWLVWDGMRYARDDDPDNKPRMISKAIASVREFGKIADDKRVRAWATKSESEAKLKSAINLSKEMLHVPSDALDSDKYTLNTLSGIVDLRTGKLSPHSRNARLTNLAKVKYDPKAKAPRFEKFLHEVMPDKKVRDWMQTAIGYAATGSTVEQMMVILHGPGRNGKSLLVNTIAAILGKDYSCTVDSKRLLGSANGSGDDYKRTGAALRGKRLVVSNETKKGVAIDEAQIKALTSDEPIVGARLYKDAAEFDPTHTVFLTTNPTPRIQDGGYAMWRRLVLVPFDVIIGADDVDLTLKDKLLDEAEGVLRWVVDGAVKWCENRDVPLTERLPVALVEAREEYQEEEDRVIEWARARTKKGNLKASSKTFGRSTVSDLHRDYEAWCSYHGDKHIKGRKSFSQQLVSNGHKRKRYEEGYCFALVLRADREKLPSVFDDSDD
jgi:P4 family phage/plasmid primase-like protien